MKTLKMETLKNWVDKNNVNPFLKIEHITEGANGYPLNTDDAFFVCGFDNFEQLQEFAEEFKTDIHLFKKRDGWHFWQNLGEKYKPLSVHDYMTDEGDDCNIIDLDNEVIQDQLKDLAEDFDGDFSEIELYIQETQQKLEAIEDAAEGFTVLQNGCEIETVETEMLSYHSDVWSFTLGALFTTD